MNRLESNFFAQFFLKTSPLANDQTRRSMVQPSKTASKNELEWVDAKITAPDLGIFSKPLIEICFMKSFRIKLTKGRKV